MASTETMSASRHLEERSPNRRARSPRRGADTYRPRKDDRRGSPAPASRAPPPAAEKPEKPEPTAEEKRALAKAEYERLLTVRSGGVYVPPHRLRALQAQIGDDKTSKEYQRIHWEALKKSINGLINKVNVSNIKMIVPELFSENLIRGRGLFCQSLTKAQAASLPFTPIYAAVAAIVNTKLPNVGELLIKRLTMRFRKAFKRNDKSVCLSTCIFLAHLVNTKVCHEMLVGQILLTLLSRPTDDSVEIAVGLTKEVGQFLEEMNPQVARAIFDRYRTILNEADLERRTQYAIEVLFQIRKDKFKDNPTVKEELDLVEDEDQITHNIYLDDEQLDTADSLNIFKYDENFEANEEEYKKLKAEILGEASDDEDDEDDEDDSEDESEDEEQKAVEIKDQSNADLVNLRRTVYLSIMSSASPTEATHKLMKLKLPAGQEPELVSMIVESCAQEKTYLNFFGLIGENFSKLNRMWTDLFETSFANYYETIHRYETNKLRNIAMFFGHLFSTDSISWHSLGVIHLNEEETTAASRIFLRILFEHLQENLGAKKLSERLADETLRPSLGGLFPHDEPKNIRFAINYLTAIKMGYLTDEMRTYLQNMPRPALPAAAAADDSDSDSVSSYSSYTGSSYSRSPSRSRSRSPVQRRGTGRDSRSPSRTPARNYRERSYSRTRSPTGSRSPSRSPTPVRRQTANTGGRGRLDSRSPQPQRRRSTSYSSRSRSPSRTPSRSRSPTPRRTTNNNRGRTLSRSPHPRRRSPSYSSRSRSPSRTPSRSRSPPPRRQAAARERSATPPRRQLGGGRPNERDQNRGRDRSPPPARRRDYSASRTPPRRPAGNRDRSASPPRRELSASRTPPRRYRERSYSRSRSRSASRSPVSPVASKGRDARGRAEEHDRSPTGVKRRRYSSGSRSRSPLPAKRGRRSS